MHLVKSSSMHVWPSHVKLILAHGALFSRQTFWAVAEGLKSSCTLLVGVDLYCHCLCHCLCGQRVKIRSLLAEYYNTANASSDPWNLPSIEMNHTDGRFVIQQKYSSTRTTAKIFQYMCNCVNTYILNSGWNTVCKCSFSSLWRLHYSYVYIVHSFNIVLQ